MFPKFVKFFQKALVQHPQEVRFLALQRSAHDRSGAGQWDFPGGKVDFGETHLVALAREIWEETQLTISVPSVIDLMTKFKPTEQVYSIFVAYHAQASSTNVVLSDEHSAYRWLTLAEWSDIDAPAELKHMIRIYETRCLP
jgi:8-oxo-dGTP diphosphatase